MKYPVRAHYARIFFFVRRKDPRRCNGNSGRTMNTKKTRVLWTKKRRTQTKRAKTRLGMKQKHAKTNSNNSMPSIPFFSAPQHQRKTNKLQTKIRNQEIKNSAAGKMKKYVVIHLYHTHSTSLYTDSIHFLSQCGVFSTRRTVWLWILSFSPYSVSHFFDLFCPYLYLDRKKGENGMYA